MAGVRMEDSSAPDASIIDTGSCNNVDWCWTQVVKKGVISQDENHVEVVLDMFGLEERVKLSKKFVRDILEPAADIIQILLTRNSVQLVGIVGPLGTGKSVLSKVLSLIVFSKEPVVTWDSDTCLGIQDPKSLDDKASFWKEIEGPGNSSSVADPSAKVVILEGAHLCSSEQPWPQVAGLLDALIYLEPKNYDQTNNEWAILLQQRLVARKMLDGIDRKTTEDMFGIDYLLNAQSIVNNAQLVFKQIASANKMALKAIIDASDDQQQVDGSLHTSRQNAYVLVIGPNPALQKTLVFPDGLRLDSVNRAGSMAVSVGGKGQQFARAFTRFISLQGPSDMKGELFQFLGGPNGDQVQALLKESKVQETTVVTKGETRTCITCVQNKGDGSATELIEPSLPVEESEVKAMLAKVQSAISAATAVAFCGTMPPGAQNLYHDIAVLKQDTVEEDQGPLLFLDGYKGVTTTLAMVDVLKINRTELETLARQVLKLGPDSFLSCAEYVAELFGCFPNMQTICVTDGGKRAFLFQSTRYCWFEFSLCTFDAIEIINPIGAGDTVGAVTLASAQNEESWPLSFAVGLAAGSASCLQLGGADFLEKDLARLFSQQSWVKQTTRGWREAVTKRTLSSKSRLV